MKRLARKRMNNIYKNRGREREMGSESEIKRMSFKSVGNKI